MSERTERKKEALPLASETPGAVTVSVYDPAMCCPSGVCGPSMDPELTRISGDLRWAGSRGARVERYNLAQEPDAFVSNPRVAGLMQAFGERALPAVLVGGEVIAHGRYPSREEILAAVGGAVGEHVSDEASSSGCCEPGSGCC